MTPHEKLQFIQNIVYELLDGELAVAGAFIKVDGAKEKLQEILYVIERVSPTHSEENGVLDEENVHSI